MVNYNTRLLIFIGIVLVWIFPILGSFFLIRFLMKYFIFASEIVRSQNYPELFVLVLFLIVFSCFILGGLLSYKLNILWRNRAFIHTLNIKQLYYRSYNAQILTIKDNKKFLGIYKLRTQREEKLWNEIKKNINNNITLPSSIEGTLRKVSHSSYKEYFWIVFLLLVMIRVGYSIYFNKLDNQLIFIGIFGLLSLIYSLYSIQQGIIITISDYGIEKKSHGLIARNNISNICINNTGISDNSYSYEFTYDYNNGSQILSEVVDITYLDISVLELEGLLKKYNINYKLYL